MRKFWIFIFSMVIFSCSQKPEGYRIIVNLEGAEGKILLEQVGPTGMIPVDTAEIVSGIAILEGQVTQPGDYYLSLLGQRARALVFVENTEMNVTGRVDSIQMIKVTGSVTHDEYNTVKDKIQKIGKEYMVLYQQSREATATGDNAKAQELMNKVNDLYRSTYVVMEDFIKQNPESFATPFFLTNIKDNKTIEEIDALVSALDPKLNSVPSIVNLKELIAKSKRVAVGQIAPDFTQNDPEGNPVKFSDVYSQNDLTLLDFWASWCGPCRVENPNVVAVYNDYKNKGFTVFGVSLDREKESWLKAIKDDNLDWTHVSDLAYWQNEVSQMYDVKSIPSSLIVDKTGKIIAKDKRGQELRATVSEILD